MRILFLCHTFNSLSQRLFVELRERGHEVSVELDVRGSVSREAVDLFQPDLILAPFLKTAIPAEIWRFCPTMIIHPGIPGDRGPSALDWAILNQESTWGVSVLAASEDMDAGDVWAYRTFAMRPGATKGDLYRREVADGATEAVLEALESFSAGLAPTPQQPENFPCFGQARPLMTQAMRAIDWAEDDTATVLRKIRSADGFPGVLDCIDGQAYYLSDAHEAAGMEGTPGEVIARCNHSIVRATMDGAVWIGQLRRKDEAARTVKMPAVLELGEKAVDLLPEQAPCRTIRYEQDGEIGYLSFDFYNGAFSTEHCEALLAAIEQAKSQPTKVLVLLGGEGFWSNGLHLSVIEGAASPADESWRNINAMNDVVLSLITCTDKLVISALRGNAGAGGVFMALAADRVWMERGVILNPHYKGMGNLYGSEYWTYLLPRRVGPENAEVVTQARLPMGQAEALRLGLVDDVFTGRDLVIVKAKAEALLATLDLEAFLAEKAAGRAADEAEKPLADYRAAELEQMRLNFYGFDPSYHVARYNFIRKVPKSRTPLAIASHRRRGAYGTTV